MRPSNERHPGSERGLQRVCPPLRYVSSGAQKIAKSREAAEFQDQGLPSYVVPEFRVLAAQIWSTHRDLLGSENRKRSLSVREILRIFGAGGVADGAHSLRQRHPGRETQTPVPTKLGPVDLQVETQVCADPTLPTASRSGKLSRLAWSIT